MTTRTAGASRGGYHFGIDAKGNGAKFRRGGNVDADIYGKKLKTDFRKHLGTIPLEIEEKIKFLTF